MVRKSQLQGPSRNVTPITLTHPPNPNNQEESRKELVDDEFTRVTFHDEEETQSGSKPDIEFVTVPLSVLPNKLSVEDTDGQRSSWDSVSSGQQNAISAMTEQQYSTGSIIRCETNKTEFTEHPYRFSREVASGIACSHYTYTEFDDGRVKFEWVVTNMTEGDIRQLSHWITLSVFTNAWAAEHNHFIDRMMCDGSVILADGNVVQTPYSLTDFESGPQ